MTTFRHLMLLVAAMPACAVAQPFHSLEDIDARVVEALAGTGLAAWPVDRRLKLAACAVPLTVDPPVAGAVAVHCASPGWRLRLLLDGPPATFSITPVLIKRGDPVTVNFDAPGFTITASGIAETEARRGERVRVRVDQKANPVMGEAIDAGTVRIGALN